MSILTRRCQWRAGHSCSSVFLDGHINVINSSEKHRRRAISCTPPPTHRRVPPSANHVPLVATAPPPQVDTPGRPTLAPAHQRQTPPRRTTLVGGPSTWHALWTGCGLLGDVGQKRTPTRLVRSIHQTCQTSTLTAIFGTRVEGLVDRRERRTCGNQQSFPRRYYGQWLRLVAARRLA